MRARISDEVEVALEQEAKEVRVVTLGCQILHGHTDLQAVSNWF
jgi:hypothetical protein